MDPFTLFALANGAVAAVKKGCQLYKDIKSAAGDVKGVLKDLDAQFAKAHPPDKPASSAAVKQLNEEKARVVDLNKRSEEAPNLYTEIGEYLGQYYDNYFKCVAVLEEEEKKSKTEVYTGGDSLAKRALKRVLMKKQLEQMGTELRELMTYQSPPELGALFSEVEAMTKELGKQQRYLIVRQMEREAVEAKRKAVRMKHYEIDFALGVAFLAIVIVIMFLFMYISHDAQKRWPQLNTSSGQEYRRRLELLEIQEAEQKLEKRKKELEREQ
jgi:hypothetical protein